MVQRKIEESSPLAKVRDIRPGMRIIRVPGNLWLTIILDTHTWVET